MMKRILFAFFLLSSLLPAKAQEFRVGLLGGVNVTDVDGMDLVDPDNDFKKFGFTAGIYVNAHIAPKTLLQMEIAYSGKGSQIPPDTTNNNAYYTLKLQYVDVDLVLRHNLQHVNVSKNPSDKFSIEGGLSAGYLFHYYFEAQSITYTLPLKTMDFSALVGFSYNFSDNVSLDFRYYNSILSIFQNNGTSSPIYGTNLYFLYYGSWNKGHNLVFQLTLKYTFGSGQKPETTEPPASAPAPPKN